MALRLITAAADVPVSLEEAKQFLKVDHDDDNDLITALLASAVAYVEGPTGFLGRVLIDQTWELVLDAFPTENDGVIQIPMPPLIEVESVVYDDSNGDEQTLSTDSYTVDNVSEPGWVVPTDGTWVTPYDGINVVRVRFRAGYLDQTVSPAVEAVPDDIKNAIKLRVKADYDQSPDADSLRKAAEILLRGKRIHLGMA